MRFEIRNIEIKDLIELYENKKLDLNPPYQRNEIWSTKSRKLLVDSINKNFPLPNFFVRIKSKDIWEMVDGQQRSRAIIGFYKQKFPIGKKEFYNKDDFPEFLLYKLAVVFISDLGDDETIEDFYVRVNSTGLKLNRPELKKAEYFDTKFLSLLNELAVDEKFTELELFTETALNRMNDIDFVSELVAQLKYGITEKKDAVDNMFENDISSKDYSEFKSSFLNVLGIFQNFNEISPIKKTRYKQRNDFYTLFYFIHENIHLSQEVFNYFYRLLVLIDEDISPSNDECEPFMNYALNCVSQSNSKQARQLRYGFYRELLLNKGNKLSETQHEIMQYYEMELTDTRKVGSFVVIDIYKLQEIVSTPQVAISKE